MLTNYAQIKKIRDSLIEEIEVEFPSLALSDKLMIVEMRIHSVLTANLDDKTTLKDAIRRNRP